jgi:hypothetical protein
LQVTGCWPNFAAIGCTIAAAKLLGCICHITGPGVSLGFGCWRYVCDWNGDTDIDLADIAAAMNCTSEICDG